MPQLTLEQFRASLVETEKPFAEYYYDKQNYVKTVKQFRGEHFAWRSAPPGGALSLIHSPQVGDLQAPVKSPAAALSPLVRRRHRAWNRCLSGFLTHPEAKLGKSKTNRRDSDYQFCTLTTPEHFTGDLNALFGNLVRELKDHGIHWQYFGVREFNKRGTCVHIHLIIRMNYFDYKVMGRLWLRLTGARWEHSERMYGEPKRCANYIMKYMTKAPVGQRSFWYSQGWIYKGYSAVNHDYLVLSRKYEWSDLVGGVVSVYSYADAEWHIRTGQYRSLRELEFKAMLANYPSMPGELKRLSLRSQGDYAGSYVFGLYKDVWHDLYRRAVRFKRLDETRTAHGRVLDMAIQMYDHFKGQFDICECWSVAEEKYRNRSIDKRLRLYGLEN